MRTDTTALSADQSLILGTAARRRDRLVVPRPAGLRARGAVRRRLLAALLARGLVEERPAKDEALAWRRDERGRHRALRLTPAGMAAAGTASEGASGADADAGAGPVGGRRPAPTRRPSPRSPVAATSDGEELAAVGTAAAPVVSRHPPGGKLGQVLEAVGAPGGATLSELVGLTGWRPHTARAALARLRQRGHGLHLDASGERKAYRLGPVRQG